MSDTLSEGVDSLSLDSDATDFSVTEDDVFEQINFTPDFEAQGITKSEYDIAVKVLNSFKSHPDNVNKQAFKELRVLGLKIFVEGVGPRLFEGSSETKYKKKKAARVAAARREIIKKAEDKAYINSRTYRMGRMEQFNKLMEDGLPVVAPHLLTDKPSETTENTGKVESTEQQQIPFDPEHELHNARSCYICKCRFYKLHSFYDLLCPECASLSWTKRQQSYPLNGYVAIVTGARIKIGYQCAIKLLRCGATVVVTTRFPHDAALRFAKEEDYSEFQDRIHIYGLDMRNLKSVEEFVSIIKNKFSHLEILINNACQTVRKPPAFYKHLMDTEMKALEDLPENVRPLLNLNSTQHNFENNSVVTLNNVNNSSAALSQMPLVHGDDVYDEKAFPVGKFDNHNQQLDLRDKNTWLSKLEEIPTIELIEVTTINSLAPFILNSQLKPLMVASPMKDKFVINVSAMEGKFYRYKTAFHPHTNMAKASLNMLTRTSASDFAQDRIWMNSVDTGWVTEENPFMKAVNYAKTANFVCPLDEIEAMARILDPIFDGLATNKFEFGKFWKDYHETEW